MTELLDELEAVLVKSSRMPFFRRLLVNEEQAITLLDRLRASVPEEVRQARQVLREQEQILEQARRHSQRIVEQAHVEASMRLEEEGLLSEAQQRSSRIVDDAHKEAEAIRRGADGYARDVLMEIETRLTQAQQEIGDTLTRFLISVRKGLDALDAEEEAGEEETPE
jgi:F0F1-type ATP synthase membrane subunit b/b'